MKLETLVPVNTPQAAKPVLDIALREFILSEVQVACEDGAERAVRLAKTMIDGALADVEQRLASMEAPPRMVARIAVNEITTDFAAGEELSEQTAEVIAEIIRNTKLGLNTMLVGPAGCGKTTMAALAAKALQVPFGLISWTAGMSETPALFARWDGTKYIEAQWSAMYRKPGIFCHDEMDRADPNALCKINAGTANGHFYNEVLCETITRHKDFGVVATCNTVGRGGDSVYTGANALDGSSLDRFVKVMVDYDAVYEQRACPDKGIYKLLNSARAKLRELQAVEILSTRSFQQVYLTFTAGKPLQACIDSLTAGWNPDLIKQVGLDAESVSRLSDAKQDAKETRSSDLQATKSKPVGGKLADFEDSSQTIQKHVTDAKSKIAANEAKMEELKRRLAGFQS